MEKRIAELEPRHVWTWNVPKNAHIEDIDSSMVVIVGLIDHSIAEADICVLDIEELQNDGTLITRLHSPVFFSPSQ